MGIVGMKQDQTNDNTRERRKISSYISAITKSNFTTAE
jgi:hypothetical protein